MFPASSQYTEPQCPYPSVYVRDSRAVVRAERSLYGDFYVMGLVRVLVQDPCALGLQVIWTSAHLADGMRASAFGGKLPKPKGPKYPNMGCLGLLH